MLKGPYKPSNLGPMNLSYVTPHSAALIRGYKLRPHITHPMKKKNVVHEGGRCEVESVSVVGQTVVERSGRSCGK